jgi:hypothetical protein
MVLGYFFQAGKHMSTQFTQPERHYVKGDGYRGLHYPQTEALFAERHQRRILKQRERRSAMPGAMRKERNDAQFTDERAEQIWKEKYSAQELEYYRAKASPFERRGSVWA